MSKGRKMITADHVNGLHLERDVNILTAMATDGPSGVGGRGIQVFMSDEAVRLLLAHMATDSRWSAAFDAVAADREARIAETTGTRTLPEHLRSRARLAGAMRALMDRRDKGDSGRPEDSAPARPVIGISGLAKAVTLDESYGALVTIGSAFMHAGAGITTEVREDDGTVIALITPPGGPS